MPCVWPPALGVLVRASIRRKRCDSDVSCRFSSIRPGRRLQAAISLKDFMHRTRVLHLYRNLLKCVRRLDDVAEARGQIRGAFKAGARQSDRLSIRMLLSDGERQLRFLQSFGSDGRKVDSTEWGGRILQETHEEQSPKPVGRGWPWERNPK